MINVALLHNHVRMLLLLWSGSGGRETSFLPPLPGCIQISGCCVPPLFLFEREEILFFCPVKPGRLGCQFARKPKRAWQGLCFKALPPIRRGFPSLRRLPISFTALHVLTPWIGIQAPPLLAALPPREHLYAAVPFAADGAASAAPGRFSAWAAHTTPFDAADLIGPGVGLLHLRRYVIFLGCPAQERQKPLSEVAAPTTAFCNVCPTPQWGA